MFCGHCHSMKIKGPRQAWRDKKFAQPKSGILSFKIIFTGICETITDKRPLWVNACINAPSFILFKIFGAMPPPINTPSVAREVKARFPASAP